MPSSGGVSLHGTSTNGELLDGSFLTALSLSQSSAANNSYMGTKTNGSFHNYASANEHLRQQSLMSPIPEMNSSKGSNSNFNTMESNNTPARIAPGEERKLTGTGKYNMDTFKLDPVDDEEYYSDDFESVSKATI